MRFGEITKAKGKNFIVSKMSGILGLAYDSISVDRLPTWLTSSSLKDKSFSFYLHANPEKSFMVIPGTDSENFTTIQTHEVVEKTYWALQFTSMTGADGKAIDTSAFKAVIDTGTSLMVGPEALVNQLIDGINVE